MFKINGEYFKGPENENDLEKKIFKMILTLAAVISAVNIILNFSLGLELITNFKWVFMFFTAVFIMKLIQKDFIDFFYLKLSFYLLVILVFLPLAWFQSGGSNNNVISYMFLLLISLTFLFKKPEVRNRLVLILISVFILIYTAEYFYPELLTEYSKEVQFIVKLVQTPIVLMAAYLLLLQYAKAYNHEKSKLGLTTRKLQLLNEKLKDTANRDPLTKKFNRRAFDQEIQNIFKNKINLNMDITLILFDIDNFKDINDDYGHDIGDQVLIKLADELENTMPEDSFISRWGGDEFAVICYKSEIKTQKYLDEYYANIEGLSAEMNITITVSAGMSRLEKNDQINKLFKRVDDILYKSKEEGKNRYTVA